LYECHLLAGDATKKLAGPKHAKGAPTMAEFELTFRDAEKALEALAYFKTRSSELIMRSMRALMFRAEPDSRELLLVRTASIEVLRTIERESRLAVARALAARDAAGGAAEDDDAPQGDTRTEGGASA
jgi:tRNA/rRNA methyltransferase/tRNA (cytidine32/uridine32-2'-O)-methyltransferase